MIRKLASFLILIGLATTVHASVIIDTTTVGPTVGPINPSTWSITIGSGINRGIVVECYESVGSLVHIASMTVGTSAMSFGRRDTATTQETEIWYTTAPPTGAQVISVYSSARHYCGATSFFNVNQLNPVDTSSGAITSGSSPSITFNTSVSTDMLVDVIGQGVSGIPSLVPNAGQTLQWTLNSIGGFTAEGSSIKPVGLAGPQTMGWTLVDSVQAFSILAVQNSTSSPNVGSISPNQAGINTGGFTLTVTGDNFSAGSLVYWNGASRTTTFVDANHITIAIAGSDITAIASVPVYVLNPDGAQSAPFYFNITGDINYVWVTDGGYKPTQTDTYGVHNSTTVTNTLIWDGKTAHPYQALNELNGFAIVLENGTSVQSSTVSVSMPVLTGPNGYVISSTPAITSTMWNWNNRPIEEYLVRYVPISGLTRTLWGNYDEQAVPSRMQATYAVNGNGQGIRSGLWTSRADHDKYYPDPLVPMEAVVGSTFTVYSSSSQAIWVDIYTPKTSPPGIYTGVVNVYEGAALSTSVPISLTVYPFTMPDVPYAKVYAEVSGGDINTRQNGSKFPNYTGLASVYTQSRLHYYQELHRMGMTPVGDGSSSCGNNLMASQFRPCDEYIMQLNGTLYSPATGYANAPGVNTGETMYSMFTYAPWNTAYWPKTYAGTCLNANNWVTWFQQNFPNVEYWWYVADEPSNFAPTNQYSTWVTSCPAPGNQLKSFVTADPAFTTLFAPNVTHVATTVGLGSDGPPITGPPQIQAAVSAYLSNPSKSLDYYGGDRPWYGTMATEDDGVAMLVRLWGLYKKNFTHYFVWQTTYYDNIAGGAAETDVYNNARTFGYETSTDTVYGLTAYNYANGDGVFLYPGTDYTYPNSSYGVDVPFPSWRIMMMRRGINDFDLLTMAAKYDPLTVNNIVSTMLPKVNWEYGVFTASDPTYQYGGVSWTTDTNVWNINRQKLYKIIADHQSANN